MDLYGPVTRHHEGECVGCDGGVGQVSVRPYAPYAAGDCLLDDG
ncbi:MAG: hypothetical protein QG657_1622, partial [Acidobacteriota bacterium]|nr:hypothetical protein [Acidobacteriota bacterium]